jgi:hypothetical protein
MVDELGPLPTIHPREELVRKAEAQLREAISGVYKLELTTGELLRAVNNVLSGEIAAIAKHSIRHERHPDEPDKPGGLE